MASAFSDVEHPWSWLHREEIKCSCCGDQVNPFNNWFRHPILKTIQCSKCRDFYKEGNKQTYVAPQGKPPPYVTNPRYSRTIWKRRRWILYLLSSMRGRWNTVWMRLLYWIILQAVCITKSRQNCNHWNWIWRKMALLPL